ncbi:MAG: TonB-dependent receptor [Bacteroidota bacterium]
MNIKFIGLLMLSLLNYTAFAQNGTFSGTVTDAKTGEPLIGATILLLDTDLGSTTDVSGNYTITNVPPKTYNIRASYVGYNSFTRYDVVIRSEGNIDINFQLTESAEQLQDVVVVANPFSKIEETPLSIQMLSQQEVAAYPGGNNDIAKVVQSLPGISGSVGGFRNDVIIRGGAPSENVYYLDGIEIPNINHFATQGSAGGPVGLLNVSFFEGVTLTTSSFGSQYDNVLSGVLQFDQRKGNERNFQTNVRVGASESALTLEGPLFKRGKEKSNTSFIVSARRSYLQLLFDVIGLPILPDYWDYQYKVHHQIDAYNEINFTGVGSIDDFKVNELEEYDAEQQAVQDQVPIIKQRTNTMGITWKKRFKNNSGFMQTAVSTNTLLNTFSQYTDNINQTGLYFKNDSKEQETKLRYTLTKFLGNWTTSMGASLQYAVYTNATNNLVNNFQYNTDLNFIRYGFFAQSSTKLLRNRLGISVGARTDGNTFTETGNEIYRTLSPRASLSYQLDAAGKWTWNASAGRYYKLPAYTILGFQDAGNTFVNKGATYIQSDHLVTGLEYLLTESSRITVEGFLKKYDNYPVSLTENVSLANKGGGFEVLGNEPVASIGLGRSYGAEFLYQQKFNGKLYAIAALTLYKSEFTGTDRTNFIASTWDNGQLVSLTGGYKLKRNWEISTRFRFLGRTPYAPVDEAATLANYPAVIKDFNRLGEERLTAFNQLDLRVDKKWNFKKFSLDAYIDIQNLLAAAQPSEPSYGLNRDDQGNVINPRSLVLVNTNETGSVLPSLGLVLNF